jgi:ferredoxin/coenzyme F420-reducing hydrogenase delta subunit
MKPDAQPKKLKKKRRLPFPLVTGNKVLRWIQEGLNGIFSPSLNPMYLLGSITFFLFFILLGTGLYLYIFYEMTAAGSYESVQYVTDQKYYGGIIRSFHRYAADGMVIAILLHIIQVFFSDRFRKNRWFAWITGLVILPVLWMEGVSGYFLVWDRMGQMVAERLASLFDIFTFSANPISRNFLFNGDVSSTLFFVICFLHIAVPGIMGLMAWVHCMRVTRPIINPPAPVSWAIFGSLLVLSLALPALSLDPADVSKLDMTLNIDWFYLFVFPLIHATGLSTPEVWLSAILLLGFAGSLPWIIRDHKEAKRTEPPVPTIELANCTGCLYCYDACPFEAVSIKDRSDNLPFEKEVEIITARCARCGFCVAACAYDAILMGKYSRISLDEKIKEVIAGEGEPGRAEIMVFVCENSIDVESVLSERGHRLSDRDDIAVMIIPCAGMLSRATLESVYEQGVKGVAVIACHSLDCHFREGRRRIKEGFNLQQTDFLIESMDTKKLRIFRVSPFAISSLMRDIAIFAEEMESPETEN